MSVVLQVNFIAGDYHKSLTDEQKLDGARQAAAITGLVWKLWLHNDDKRGAIYLFENLQAAKAWGDGPLLELLRRAGAKDIEAHYFEVNAAQSAVTRAPLHAAAA
jgi:hypothetical protein